MQSWGIGIEGFRVRLCEGLSDACRGWVSATSSVQASDNPKQDRQPVYYENGRWDIFQDNGYCLQWKTWKRGMRRCMDMVPTGGRHEFRTKDGELQAIVELIEGNPNGL